MNSFCFEALKYFLLVLSGVVVSSVITALISIMPQDEPFLKQIFLCPKCGKKKNPLWMLFFYGFCPSCKGKTSKRPLIIKFATSLLYITLYLRFGFSVEFIAFAFLMSIFIVVFYIDLDYMVIPDMLVIAASIGGILLFVYNIFHPLSIYGDSNWWTPLVGVAVGSGSLLLISFLGSLYYKKDAMGMGDVLLFIPIGLYTGWRMTIMSLYLSILVGGVIVVTKLALKKLERDQPVPFGPFIVSGTYLAVMFGWGILRILMPGLFR
ncbi:MAG TPA: A24 family peptidase [Clostridia bacterium]